MRMRKFQERKGIRSLKIGAALTVAAVSAALAVTASPAWAATFSLSQTQVAAAGGTTLYFTGGSAFASGQQVRFVTPAASACPALYNTANTGGVVSINAGTWTQKSVAVAYVTTPALTAGTAYEACIYASGATGANYPTDTSTDTVTAVNMGSLNSTNAQASTTVTLTTATGLLTGASYSTEFVTASSCAATYAAVVAGTVVASATTTKTSTSVLTITVPALTPATPYLVCVYNGTTTPSFTLAVRGRNTIATFSNTLPVMTMTPTGGSSGTATTVTSIAPSAIFTGTPAAVATRNTCSATYPTIVNLLVEPFAATTAKISTSKVAITVPAGVIVSGSDVSTPWNICIYSSSSAGVGTLLAAPSIYNVAPVLDLTSAVVASSSGPAQGLVSITVTGMTGIPTAVGSVLTATLGGAAITGIVAQDATSFIGVTSPHGPGLVSLMVSTAAGTKTKTSAYTYTYGITVTPNTSPSSANPTLDIMGAGFSALTFTEVVTATAVSALEAHVVLTDNAWNQQTAFTGSANVFTTNAIFPATQCGTVLPISDSEIICTLDLADTFTVASHVPTIVTATAVPDGAYTVTVVNDGTAMDERAATANISVVSNSSTFTVAAF
jgi:hypothetical protein